MWFLSVSVDKKSIIVELITDFQPVLLFRSKYQCHPVTVQCIGHRNATTVYYRRSIL